MKNFIPSLYTESEPADIVVETEQGTYIGKYDRAKFNPGMPAEEQAIWSIRFVSKPSENTIMTLYPDGVKRFVFVWNKKETYNYKFAL